MGCQVGLQTGLPSWKLSDSQSKSTWTRIKMAIFTALFVYTLGRILPQDNILNIVLSGSYTVFYVFCNSIRNVEQSCFFFFI